MKLGDEPDYPAILAEIQAQVRPYVGQGAVADYIPELAKAPLDRWGLAVATLDGRVYTAGEAEEAFSIQSISKLFSLTLALQLVGPTLWERVGREPSGDPFNSLVQLEHEAGVPRNPFINAGALVVTDAALVPHPPAAQGELHALPLTARARELGNPRVANMVGLGALVGLAGWPAFEQVERAVETSTPARFRELNLAALRAGRALVATDASAA